MFEYNSSVVCDEQTEFQKLLTETRSKSKLKRGAVTP